jgi:uncharacterized membrane protein YGL010W
MAFDLEAALDRYRRDHQHPVNQALHAIGIPMIAASLLVLPFNPLVAAAMFVLGWILQFVGHAFEGKRPTFLSDPRAILVAPLWYLRRLFGSRSEG